MSVNQNSFDFGYFVGEPPQVLEINLYNAKTFIEKWHYSKLVPAGHNIFFGWFIDNDLYAIANYGIGVNTFQSSFLSKETGFNVTDENLVELKRLCRKEPKNDNFPLTKFLSICHKKLKKMNYEYVVSFSDPEYKHNGGIYKASNFKHLGTTRPEIHFVGKNQEFVHRRLPRHYQLRTGLTFKESVKALNLIPRVTKPKDRWFIKI
jgi:hypothetical protein